MDGKTEPPTAPAGRYRADPNHSSVVWRIKHLGLAWYTGRFARFDILLDFDPASVDDMRVTAEVELRSVRTEYNGETDWDGELANDDKFLAAATWPIATFASDRIERTGKDRATVHGSLSLRGHERPLALDVTYNGAMTDHPSGVALVGFSARAIVVRSQFGLSFGVGPRMPDEVELIVEAELGAVPPTAGSQGDPA